jgi:hypothetical protein
VVEISSMGAEIFSYLMVAECLVVKLLFGMAGEASIDLFRFVVKARDSDVDMLA